MTTATASAWIAAAAFAERLVAQPSSVWPPDADRLAFGLDAKIYHLEAKPIMGRAEWAALLLEKQVDA